MDTRRASSGLMAPVCYVVGPPAMVLAMQEILRGAGVANDDIRSEEFYQDRACGDRRMLERAPWNAPFDPMEGVIVHELSARTGG